MKFRQYARCFYPLIVCLVVLPLVAGAARAQDEVNPLREKTFYIGANHPGITLGYQRNSFNFEVRAFKEDDIEIAGPRIVHNFYWFRGGNLYWALDTFYVQFEDVITEGDGYMAGPMIGLQKFLGTRFSLTADGGPYFIRLEDDLSGVESDGFQFTLNFGLNFHF